MRAPVGLLAATILSLSCAAPAAVLTSAAPAVPAPAAPAVAITFEEGAQFEIVSPGGVRVLIDVATPSELSSPPTAKDVLLTTHNHPDHLFGGFPEEFPGKSLYIRAGTITQGDVEIQGIPAAHNRGDALLAEGGTDYIFVIQTAGLRIAHFGDIGQDALTPAQLAALGKIDVAITQLDNPRSGVDMSNKAAFRLMQQIQPKLVIPTSHVSEEAIQHAASLWRPFHRRESPLRLSREKLGGTTQVVFLGESAPVYAKLTGAAHMD